MPARNLIQVWDCNGLPNRGGFGRTGQLIYGATGAIIVRGCARLHIWNRLMLWGCNGSNSKNGFTATCKHSICRTA